MVHRLLFAAIAVIVASVAVAADAESLDERMTGCAEEADDQKRLACYDREARARAVTEQSVRVETEEIPAVVTEAAEAAPAPAAAAIPATIQDTANDEAAASPEAAGEALDNFGMTSELARSKPDRAPDDELREISAVVVKVSKRPRGELVVTLDNGQTWTEKDAEYGFRVKVGDTVVVKKTTMGGYRMVGRGRRASSVRRID